MDASALNEDVIECLDNEISESEFIFGDDVRAIVGFFSFLTCYGLCLFFLVTFIREFMYYQGRRVLMDLLSTSESLDKQEKKSKSKSEVSAEEPNAATYEVTGHSLKNDLVMENEPEASNASDLSSKALGSKASATTVTQETVDVPMG
ncbi:unnamed protein product [Caenorhabditis sp. 36 PRJEB53466]|nr:unnamed protein product [Caenorhabditis sp. 36 PRJEB53466]